MTKPSKQLRWKQRKLSHGLCGCCGATPKAPGRQYCKDCLERDRERSRNAYRLKNGIPLDQPIQRRQS